MCKIIFFFLQLYQPKFMQESLSMILHSLKKRAELNAPIISTFICGVKAKTLEKGELD